MTVDLTLLDSEFGEKAGKLLKNCEDKGVKIVPFFGVRDPWLQARLWRQSRPLSQIEAAIRMLKNSEAQWLADVLENVGPQYGRWATNLLPGLSWHNYGEALDGFVMDMANGRAIWNANHDGYRIYAREAVALGLVPGYYWRRRDVVHVQNRQERVREKYTWVQIEDTMKGLYRSLPEAEKPVLDDPGQPEKDVQEDPQPISKPSIKKKK